MSKRRESMLLSIGSGNMVMTSNVVACVISDSDHAVRSAVQGKTQTRRFAGGDAA